MIVVIDTNVLVSAVIRDRDPEAVIEHITAQAEFTWIATSEILVEYSEVLARPRFAIPEPIQERWRKVLARNVVLVQPVSGVEFLRDRKDAKFIACAVAGKADFLITGDRDFTDAQRLIDTRIVSVHQFKRLFKIGA